MAADSCYFPRASFVHVRPEEGVPLGRLVRVAALAVVIGSMTVAYTEGASRAAVGARAVSSRPGRHRGPELKSNVALVIDAASGETLYAKHSTLVAPIASITKLMTAMVVLDAQSPLDETIEIDRADVDTRKHTRSRLPVGARLRRWELLLLSLMASENRAATALARTYPGGDRGVSRGHERQGEGAGDALDPLHGPGRPLR